MASASSGLASNLSSFSGIDFLSSSDLKSNQILALFELSKQLNLKSVEKNIEPYDVYNSDEAFITATPFCILPVSSLNKVKIRTKHSTIFNIKDPEGALYDLLTNNNFICSKRGNGVRISFNFFNNKTEIKKLIKTIKKFNSLP